MRKIIRALTCGILAASLLVPGIASAAAAPLPFVDIDRHWAKSAIVRGVQYGLFSPGDGTRMFYPNRDMTRAEFLVLLDRVYYGGQYQIYPLTLLSEHAEWSKGEGFDVPYLPYKDVDRLTWMYNPILRISVLLDRMYGPNAIQSVFPGEQMNPNQPITQEEAAKLLMIFTMGTDSTYAWEEISKWRWLEGERNDPLKRGEAAVAMDRLIEYLLQDSILPLLDYDGYKYPVIPEVEEIFPLFVTYAENKTAEEQLYVDAVNDIVNQWDSEQTFADLRKLEKSDFSNRVGIHYYLSWDPHVDLAENLEEAFRAIDAYFADKLILPDTLQLLSANVYDLALQLGNGDPGQFAPILERLASYEKKTKPGTKEWEALSIYLAALEVKNGQLADALKRYHTFSSTHPEALLNETYYLLQQGERELAENLVASVKPHSSDKRMQQLLTLLQQDLESLKKQDSIATDLAYSMRRLKRAPSFRVQGESMLNGYLFKYTQDVDQSKRVSLTSGYMQSPYKPILEKMEAFTDLDKKIQYTYDPEADSWKPYRTDSDEYLYEWVGSLTPSERIRQLNARYYLQSYGPYDVITEWIPRTALEEKARDVRLVKGKVEHVPLYVNKYYIDRESDMIVQHFWRYEEVYEGGTYVVSTGTDRYDYRAEIQVKKPEQLGNEVRR